jgi:hypothetical protein
MIPNAQFVTSKALGGDWGGSPGRGPPDAGVKFI